MRLEHGSRPRWPTFAASCTFAALLACGDDGTAGDTPPLDATTTAVNTTSTDGTPQTTRASGTTTNEATTGSDDTGATTTGTSDGLDPRDGRWVDRSPLLGGPRQEVGVVAAADRVWMLGGLVGAETLARVEAYDPRTDSWEAYPDLPLPMHHPNAASVDDRIIVAGFLRGTEFAADGNVFVFSTQTQVWELGTPMPGGSERGASATTALGGLVYVIGGRREGVAVADAWTYDVDEETWARIADLPAPRDHMVIGVIDGRLYVVGGRDGSITAHTDRVDVYDPAADAWSSAASMPTSRGGMAAGVLGGLLFVAGGEGNDADPSGVFAEVEVYDPIADAWSSVEPMPIPRHGTGGAVIDGELFIPGGADVEGGGAVDVHEAWLPFARAEL